MIADVKSVQTSLGIIGNSPLLLDALNAAIQAAPYDVSVLVTGENGTGKEVFHKILHRFSPTRRNNNCIAVNCGGLPEGTIDSELFGHVKGAYTGATTDRKGYFEEANGGTIFLDEVGELPLSTQAKLLRILETGEYYRMGSSDVLKTNVRVVAATNVDLHEAIRKGKFREDLYYRLSTITINVPPLRARENDIRLLFSRFAMDTAQKYKMPPIQLDYLAMNRLMAYDWPGNVRQLLHVVEEISIVEQGYTDQNGDRTIGIETLNKYLPAFTSSISVGNTSSSDQGSTFGIGEKEMLYKVIFEMKKQLEEVRHKLGLSGNTETHVTHALPAPTTVETSFTSAEPKIHVMPEVQPDEYEEIKTLEEIEREAINAALKRNNGNKKKAADELGISTRTIDRNLVKNNLE